MIHRSVEFLMVYFFKLRFPFLWVLFVFKCRSTKLMVAGCINLELLAVIDNLIMVVLVDAEVALIFLGWGSISDCRL